MFRQFLREEKGQTTVEYLLIIAVIVVAVSIFGKAIQSNMGKTVQGVFDGINKKVQQLMSASLN
jgi:Flp pilus assembly pilin Flp